MGSGKFCGLLTFAWLCATVTQVGALVLFPSIKTVASGPYTTVFALLPYFWRKLSVAHGFTEFIVCTGAVPKLHPRAVTVFGIPTSEKTTTYLLAAAVALSGGLSTIVAAASGFLAGLMHEGHVMSVHRVAPPGVVRRFFNVCSISSPPLQLWHATPPCQSMRCPTALAPDPLESCYTTSVSPLSQSTLGPLLRSRSPEGEAARRQ